MFINKAENGKNNLCGKNVAIVRTQINVIKLRILVV